MKYPEECPVFACDRYGDPWAICIGVGVLRRHIAFPRHVYVLPGEPDEDVPNTEGLIAAEHLRPLTRAAREMLALVQP